MLQKRSFFIFYFKVIECVYVAPLIYIVTRICRIGEGMLRCERSCVDRSGGSVNAGGCSYENLDFALSRWRISIKVKYTVFRKIKMLYTYIKFMISENCIYLCTVIQR